MVQLVCLGALLVLVSPISSQEVVCKSGERETVTLKGGDEENNSFRLDSRRQRRRGSCIADYDTEKCSKVSINCPVFATRAYFRCRWGDYMDITDAVSTKRFCRSSGPEMLSPEGDFKIRFRQGFRRAYGDVQCEITCVPKEDGGDDDGGDDDGDDGDDDGSGGDETKKCNCGLASRKKRIVGGKETEVSEYPWQIGMVHTGKSSVWCGGSVISDQWILTAAHCVPRATPNNIEVLLGEHDYKDKTETKEIRAKVTKIISHPKYNDQTMDMDFALLKLEKKIDFSANSHIRPICLPDNVNELYTNAESIVTGWGTTSSGGSASSTLQEVMVKVISNSDCNKDYSGKINSNMICAKRSGKDACQGDSGGPLVSSKGDGVTAGQNYEQVGVVSWGYGCAHAKYPGVYARTTTQLDWIRQETSSSWTTCPRK